MKYYFGSRKQDLDRIQTPVDENLQIEAYGRWNLYPQEQDFLRLSSPLIKAACKTLEDFINGNGWEQNGEEVLNDEGELADDLLNLASMDYSRFDGFALWLGFDGTGSINEIKHIPFQYVRFSKPDALGKHTSVKVSNNWEAESDGYKAQPQNAVEYPLFNPLTAAEETISGGSGQVLYYTGVKDMYPLSTFDSINDTGITDSEVQAFEKNTATKGFLGTTLFKLPGNLEGEQEQAAMVKKIQQLQGSDSPGILVMQGLEAEEITGNIVETIAPNNNDALFSLTRTAILERTLQAYNVPPALMGVNPVGGVFSMTAYKESFITYNVITRNRRKTVARVFNTLGALLDTPVSFGEIIENAFEISGQEDELDDQPNQFQEAEPEEGDNVPTEETEAKIKRIYG